MGLADTFGKEDRVEVKFSDFYDLVKGCTERDFLINAIKARVPHNYIESMVDGKKHSWDGEKDEQDAS